jgi:hypothetical protein
MTAGLRDRADNKVPYLVSQARELKGRQLFYVSRRGDGIEQHQKDL